MWRATIGEASEIGDLIGRIGCGVSSEEETNSSRKSFASVKVVTGSSVTTDLSPHKFFAVFINCHIGSEIVGISGSNCNRPRFGIWDVKLDHLVWKIKSTRKGSRFNTSPKVLSIRVPREMLVLDRHLIAEVRSRSTDSDDLFIEVLEAEKDELPGIAVVDRVCWIDSLAF